MAPPEHTPEQVGRAAGKAIADAIADGLESVVMRLADSIAQVQATQAEQGEMLSEVAAHVHALERSAPIIHPPERPE